MSIPHSFLILMTEIQQDSGKPVPVTNSHSASARNAAKFNICLGLIATAAGASSRCGGKCLAQGGFTLGRL